MTVWFKIHYFYTIFKKMILIDSILFYFIMISYTKYMSNKEQTSKSFFCRIAANNINYISNINSGYALQKSK